MWKVTALLFIYFVDFLLHVCSFDQITTSGLNLTSYLNSVYPFSYKDAIISGAGTIFGDFYDDNVCTFQSQICHRKWIHDSDFL